MKLSQLKPPRRGGAKKAAETFEKDRKREPSDRLVRIISEYEVPPSKRQPQKEDRAAKDTEI